MEVLINTPGQTFYSSSIDELLNYCEEKDNCAVIIFHADVNDFIEKLNDKINSCVSQLIVIADNVDDVIAKASDKDLLIISAINIKDAIQIALNSSAMCKDVICVSNIESSKNFTDMVEMVII
tara:strand:- start:1850 stop:2218 length:369 start_codon:yes stop_codon:yes gene_type:complete